MAKMKLSQRLSRALELPADAALPVPRLEITGRNDILITGKAVLLEYSPELVRVARDSCEVTVRGTDLRICAMDKMGMQVLGLIASVEFRE
ncbi:MAG: YabP/YqfC family sporulation protein [Clostridiaceae bacterium]|nr:YabP/YqfC family sporulation protein [Clostridiaceae bacterium]MDD6273340.1 YabP/YqfC family sporulation protein [Clostridiaceae bacterium]